MQFSNYEILKEIFLDCEVDDMRRFVLGLIYCAMLKLYNYEKDKLNHYWHTMAKKTEGSAQKDLIKVDNSFLGNFINIVLANFFDTKYFVGNFL